MNFGERLKEARENRNFSQQKLAKEMGFKSQQAIARYENMTEPPKMKTVDKLADALNISRNELLGWKKIDEHFSGKQAPFDTQEELAHRTTEKVHVSRMMNLLNESGQKEAVHQIEMLTEIPRFQKKEDPAATDQPTSASDPEGSTEEY